MGSEMCIRDRALELIGRGIWKDAGVFSPEYFDPKPYLKLMEESGYRYEIKEML